MESRKDYLILTNNPLLASCMEGEFAIAYYKEAGYRDILRMARDKVYVGHTLYTHPLAGSVKPNETPYKSIVISALPRGFRAQDAEIISAAIDVCDHFVPGKRELNEKILKDFQLIDYSLLADAIDFNPEAGIYHKKQTKGQ